MAAATREAVINIRAQGRQLDLIDRAAAAVGCNRSEFMLDAACRAAEDALLNQAVIQIGPEAGERLEAMLDAPPHENPGLRALLARRPARER